MCSSQSLQEFSGFLNSDTPSERLLVLTVATDETDGFRRFMRSCAVNGLNVSVRIRSVSEWKLQKTKEENWCNVSCKSENSTDRWLIETNNTTHWEFVRAYEWMKVAPMTDPQRAVTVLPCTHADASRDAITVSERELTFRSTVFQVFYPFSRSLPLTHSHHGGIQHCKINHMLYTTGTSHAHEFVSDAMKPMTANKQTNKQSEWNGFSNHRHTDTLKWEELAWVRHSSTWEEYPDKFAIIMLRFVHQ